MIILTGGAGFIGSNILHELNRVGHKDVLIVDSLGTEQKWKNVARASFIDIVSKEDFREQMMVGDVDAFSTMIHMGACSTTTERDADYLYDNNYRYSTEVASFALQRGARFIYASSAATYGSGSDGYSDETRTLHPMNMYGYSKHLFDTWVWEQQLDSECVGLKFFNVFGPNEYHKNNQASMAYKAYNQIRETGRVKLFKSSAMQYDDGEQQRDFVYVNDVVSIVMELINNRSVNGIYNVGTGEARSWNALVNGVFSAMGASANIEYIDMPAELQTQYQNFTEAQMDRLRNALPKWKPTPLEDSLADYVQRYLSQEWQHR